jgi:hypothetical protein
VAKAIAKIEANLAALPAVNKPWGEMSPAEKLRELTALGLDKTRESCCGILITATLRWR